MTIMEQLSAPFPPADVSFRVGSTNRKKFEAGQAERRKGQALAYIDARDAMSRLDAVMGPHWQRRFTQMNNGTMCCEIGLLIEGDWLWRADGAGSIGDVKEAEREMAEKGIYSDAFKRAAVGWGVGRYLYALDAPWVDLDDWWQIPRSTIQQLRATLLSGPSSQGGPIHGQNLQPGPMAKLAPNDHPPGVPLPSPDGKARDAILVEARKNTDWKRIETLLTRNVRTIGDVHRIVNAQANLTAIRSWSDPWKGVMRELVAEAKVRAEGNRPNGAGMNGTTPH